VTACLFPRLDPLSVEQCLAGLDDRVTDAHRPLSHDRLPAGTRFAASGGSQIGFDALARLRSLIVDAARECGFPQRGGVADRARFDCLAAIVLADFDALAGGEADCDDVWAFLATVLLPDVVVWRFSGRSAERFHGGVRNAFQRLWMRIWALDGGMDAGEGRWSLLEALTEDALVQITERPSVGSDRNVSRAIATSWVRTAERIGQARMEDVMRHAIIDLRIRNEVQLLSALPPPILDDHVAAIFDRAAAPDGQWPPDQHDGVTNLPDLSAILVAPTSAYSRDERQPAEGKTGEIAIQHAILELMRDGQVWSNADLKDRLGSTLPLTEADRGVGARRAEELWENRVNNALARARASSLYSKGLVQSRGHGLHVITEQGRRQVESSFGGDQLLTQFLGNGEEVSPGEEPSRS
jgi:hypothetical protein